MAPEDQQKRIDAAFGRIEDVILPRIATMLRVMLDAAEGGETAIASEAMETELRTLGLELDALTREVENQSSVSGRDCPDGAAQAA